MVADRLPAPRASEIFGCEHVAIDIDISIGSRVVEVAIEIGLGGTCDAI